MADVPYKRTKYVCDRCMAQYADRCKLIQHLERNLCIKKCRTICKLCKQSVYTKTTTSIKEHLDVCSVLQCFFCSREYDTKKKLIAHIRKCGPYFCKKCFTRFKLDTSFSRHVCFTGQDSYNRLRTPTSNTTTTLEEPASVCSICQKVFFGEERLQKHKESCRKPPTMPKVTIGIDKKTNENCIVFKFL